MVAHCSSASYRLLDKEFRIIYNIVELRFNARYLELKNQSFYRILLSNFNFNVYKYEKVFFYTKFLSKANILKGKK